MKASVKASYLSLSCTEVLSNSPFQEVNKTNWAVSISIAIGQGLIYKSLISEAAVMTIQQISHSKGLHWQLDTVQALWSWSGFRTALHCLLSQQSPGRMMWWWNLHNTRNPLATRKCHPSSSTWSSVCGSRLDWKRLSSREAEQQKKITLCTGERFAEGKAVSGKRNSCTWQVEQSVLPLIWMERYAIVLNTWMRSTVTVAYLSSQAKVQTAWADSM